MVRYVFFLWSFLCLGFFISISTGEEYYGKFIGEFKNAAHEVKGKLYAANENTLVIVGFNYDGGGPDAYFWAGLSGIPSHQGFIIPDEKGSTEVLQRYSNRDVILKLPDGKKIQDLKWFSVWCRKFNANFGHITIPDNFDPPKEQVLSSLPTLAHGVRSGPVIVKDEKTIVVPDLYYDGAAPDAFFLVGNGTNPTHRGAVKVPHDQQSDLRIKQGYRGQTVTLTLPDDLTVFNVDWLSIYCITFQENFGNIFFPKNLNVPPLISRLMNRATEVHTSHEIPTSGRRYYGKYLGELQPSQHGVKGSVFVADETTFVIDGFHYDGAGPDAYFWADVMPSLTAQGLLISNEKNSTEILKGYMNKILVITLPYGKKVQDFQSFGVWCRKANADFGHVRIPSNLDIPKTKTLDWIPGSDDTFKVKFAIIADARTIELHNVEYLARGLDLFFYVGNGTTPNEKGIRLQNDAGSWDRINMITNSRPVVTVKLPENMTFFEFEWFAVYCLSCHKNYGYARIPRNLNVPPDVAALKASVLEFDNCEELFRDKLQVSWKVINDEIFIRLTGKRGYNEYFAFGISGHPSLSKMVGSDVAVVFFDVQQQMARAVDYSLNAKAQCSDDSGACPDVKNHGRNDVVLQSWRMNNDILSVIFKRRLTTGDPLDQIYRLHEPMSVVAAVGPLNSLVEVAFHTKYYNKDPITIHFGRSPRNNCKLLKEDEKVATDIDRHNAWPAAKIQDTNVFTAQIGPTGGTKGYTAITGLQSWGIAWWINGKLIPEITVVRGRNYTFIVEGGNNPTIQASYHPLYITNDHEGGGAQFLDEINSPNHTVYAGLTKDSHENLVQTGVGRLCEYKHKSVDMAESVDSFEDYKKTLKLDCQPGNPGQFSWIPDENTPDTVYYQCFTHRNLGWKIHVVNEEASGGNALSSFSLAVTILTSCAIALWVSLERV